MSRRRKAKPQLTGGAAPNLTPVVNVAMVVLVVFMLTASFVESERFLQSTVSAEGQGAAELPDDFVPVEPLEIRVSSPTPERFIARVGGFQLSDTAELAALLNRLREQENAAGVATEDIQVVIRPDGGVPHEFVVAVHEATIAAEMTKVAFATTAR